MQWLAAGWWSNWNWKRWWIDLWLNLWGWDSPRWTIFEVYFGRDKVYILDFTYLYCSLHIFTYLYMVDLKCNLLKQFFFSRSQTVALALAYYWYANMISLCLVSHQCSLGLLFDYPVQPSSPFRHVAVVAVVAGTIPDSPDWPAVLWFPLNMPWIGMNHSLNLPFGQCFQMFSALCVCRTGLKHTGAGILSMASLTWHTATATGESRNWPLRKSLWSLGSAQEFWPRQQRLAPQRWRWHCRWKSLHWTHIEHAWIFVDFNGNAKSFCLWLDWLVIGLYWSFGHPKSQLDLRLAVLHYLRVWSPCSRVLSLLSR